VLPSSWCWKHSGSWCFLLVGARESRELVLEKPGSWCFLLVGAARENQGVGARETRDLVLPSSGC
jgi:hypothetical protein